MAAQAIAAAQVRQLREETGAGMMECKKALVECEGDFDRARDWLRVKSGAKADKVAARQTLEGRVAFAQSGGGGALVEISCETDFVARDSNIAEFASAVAQAVAEAGAAENIAALPLAGGESVEDMRQRLVMKLGENLSVRRAKTIAAAGGAICAYVHSGDKIGAMCAIGAGNEALGRDICMHIAAMQPRYLDAAAVPEDFIAREREVFAQQAVESGKPADMAEKIAAGKLKKRLAEVALMQQPFVKDTDKTVAQVVKEAGAAVSGFALLAVGASE